MGSLITHAGLQEGRPWPLGAHWDGEGVNFAVFSAHATAIELCLFDPAGEHEIERVALPERTGDVWHGFVAGVAAGDRVRVAQGAATAELIVQADPGLAAGCVRIAAAHVSTSKLGGMSGDLSVERV